MNGKTVKFMLVGSLLINLLLAASLLIPRISRTTRALPPPPESRDLRLSPESREKIRELIRNFKIEETYQRQQIFTKRGEIIEELSKAEFDYTYLEEAVREINRIENSLNKRFVDLLIEISLNLRDSERIEALLMLSNSWLFPLHERRRS